MENFNTVPDKGTFGGSVEVINQNFSLAQQEMEMLDQGVGVIDKPYDPTKHSGLGRKVLKLGKDGSNVLTQEDFDTENTVYVIKYDFDLNGASIQIPEGCVLDFEGGSVSNGIIMSNDTKIIGIAPNDFDAFYGTFYKDNKPLNYNGKQILKNSAGIQFGFMSPGEFLDFRAYPQDICSFYYTINNERKKYYIVSLSISGSSPERLILVLLNNNYDYIGSTEIPYESHGQGLAIRDNYLYVAYSKSPSATYQDKDGIASFLLSDVVNRCVSDNVRPHSSSYQTKVQSSGFISLNHYCRGLDYDSSNEEFAVMDGDTCIHIYSKNFVLIRGNGSSLASLLEEKIGSSTVISGITYKNGIVAGMAWVYNYPNTDIGTNMLFQYDVLKNRIVSWGTIESNTPQPESEGLYKDPDNDNVFYSVFANTIDGTNQSCALIAKISNTENMFGLNTKHYNNVSSVSNLVSSAVIIDNSYDFSNGSSDGSSDRPYKYIETAILMGYDNSGIRHYLINATNTPYRLSRINLMPGCGRWCFMGRNGNPEINGSFWANGLQLELRNIVVNSDYNVCVTGSQNSYIRLVNVTLKGSSSQDGIKLEYNSSVYSSGVTIQGFKRGVNLYGSDWIGTINASNCIYGIYSDMSYIRLTGHSFTNISESGILSRRGMFSCDNISFTDCNNCFNVDDDTSIQMLYTSINVSNCSTIIKKSDDRGRHNLYCKAASNAELVNFFNFIKKGTFSNTTIMLMVSSDNLSYNEIPILRGEYSWTQYGLVNLSNGYNAAIYDNTINDYKIINVIGTTAQLPQIPQNDDSFIGFQYFDKTLNKPVFWTSNGWVDSTGSNPYV